MAQHQCGGREREGGREGGLYCCGHSSLTRVTLWAGVQLSLVPSLRVCLVFWPKSASGVRFAVFGNYLTITGTHRTAIKLAFLHLTLIPHWLRLYGGSSVSRSVARRQRVSSLQILLLARRRQKRPCTLGRTARAAPHRSRVARQDTSASGV